ncbi:hypothetical protein H2200_011977 [Cladophialophora chaetospira]|uniref:Aminoglycoside phosphotransferase domain-containing protein n=1 Tax=Cladophialophora chaetospira TaxID=386627 RepID=A0AA38WZ23_9EURO|nr:hypothetical protein H2200_011977 [Cladophialophora chaetospira]
MTGGDQVDYAHGRFPEHKILILKQAPPFIAGVGEGAPMSQDRQLLLSVAQIAEAAALRLFLPTTAAEPTPLTASDQPEPVSLYQMLTDTRVMVPKLLHHDPTNHVLVISDLGDLPDIFKIFIDLGGVTPGLTIATTEPLSHAPKLGHPLALSEITTFRTVGQQLGSFFARLHDPGTKHSVTKLGNVIHSLPAMKNTVHEHAIKPLLSQLLKFPSLFDKEEADFLRTTPPAEQCVVLGDSWTGAVLLDLSLEVGDVGVGVIDWEFSNTEGRGVNGDVSQFLAHLECLRVTAHTREKTLVSGHLPALNAIMEGIVQKYRIVNTKGFDDCILRSTLCSYGAEIINVAF